MKAARIVRIIGWMLFGVSLLAALYGVFGGSEADNYPWLLVCVGGWIISQFVLAYARRLARLAYNEDDDAA